MSVSKYRALAFVFAFSLSTLAAQAGSIVFTPNGDSNAGSLKCDVAVSSLGNLPLKSGLANISGKVITIKSGSAFVDAPRTVLIGSVLRTESNLTSQPPNITGLALFLMGDWQDQLDDGSKDMIFCRENRVEGKILGIENDSISVGVNGAPQRIPLASVLYIRSPRVFVFKIALKSGKPLQKDSVIQAETADASFRPTATARSLSGSVIPLSERNNDDPLSGLTSNRPGPAANAAGAMHSLGLEGDNVMPANPGAMPGMGNFNRPGTAVPNQNNDSFDDGEDARRFSTIHSRYGDTRMTVPPGMLGD